MGEDGDSVHPPLPVTGQIAACQWSGQEVCVSSGRAHILAVGECKRPFRPEPANLSIVY